MVGNRAFINASPSSAAPKAGDFWWLLGRLARITGHPENAVTALKRAAALLPAHGGVTDDLSRALSDQHDWNALLALADQAELDQLKSPLVQVNGAFANAYLGRPQGVLAKIRLIRRLDLSGKYTVVTSILSLLGGDEAGADTDFERAAKAGASAFDWLWMSHAQAMANRPAHARSIALRGAAAHPNSPLTHLAASEQLAAFGQRESLAHLISVIALPETDLPEDILQNCLIDLSAAGFARETLEIVQGSWLAPRVEPVLLALQILLGEPPDAVPKELLDVAHDVVARIREREPIIAANRKK